MTLVTMNIDMGQPGAMPLGRVDREKLDATTDIDIARHIDEDHENVVTERASKTRRIRKRMGLTQLEFSRRIDVPLETIRNWEQGKREPTGPARALLKILDKNPEIALAALE